MASSDSDHTSIAGISIPQWMKNKIHDRYDLEQNTFSPPADDDSFFYIRYPKTDSGPKHIENDDTSSVYRSIGDVLENHTLPCQEFIPAAKSTPRELGLKRGLVDPPLGAPKSSGTDDGFHGIGAACGHSVVAVAHQMIAGVRMRPNLEALQASSGTESEDEAATPPSSQILSRRRSSKSLPSSPQTSPKTLRKNPYFANGIMDSSDNIAAQGRETRQRWLLSYMQETKSLHSSMSDLKIPEEAPQNIPEPTVVKPKVVKIGRPKPSQLREMNFWSPTSM